MQQAAGHHLGSTCGGRGNGRLLTTLCQSHRRLPTSQKLAQPLVILLLGFAEADVAEPHLARNARLLVAKPDVVPNAAELGVAELGHAAFATLDRHRVRSKKWRKHWQKGAFPVSFPDRSDRSRR